MVRKRTGLLVTVVALPLITAIAGAQSAPATMVCAATPAPNMSPFDTAQVVELVGAFDVVMFDTTSLRGLRQHAGKLVLMLQDSLPRRRATTAKPVQEKFLVGFFEVALPDSGEIWNLMANRTIERPGVFWSDGFLRLGEFGPKSGISLFLRSVSPNEVRGMWTTQAGTAIIVDFTGDREPDEAGYFCAKRTK
jgi:hypothetical protein